MAFKKNPQVLETFGMVVPSAPRKRKETIESLADSQSGEVVSEKLSRK